MKKNIKLNFIWLACSSIFLLALASARAGTFTNNFDTGLPAKGITVSGSASPDNADTDYDFTTGGFGGTGGALKITADKGSQQSTALLDDLDPGKAVGGFEIWFKLSLYSVASAARPADGLSVNFVHTDDAVATGGTVGEDGAATGIEINFDTYDNGNEAPSIEIKVEGTVLIRQKMDGPIDGSSGPPWTTNPPFKDANGNPVNLWTDPSSCPTCQNNWTDVHILFKNNLMTVTYKGLDIFKTVFVPWAPFDGQFAFGGRTGGAFEFNYIDNLGIVTFPAPTTPAVSKVSSNPFGLTVQITDAATQVDQSSVKLSIDGASVTPTITKSAAVTTVQYAVPTPLPIGVSHLAALTYADNGSPVTAQTVNLSFTVPSYAIIPGTLAIPASGVDQTKVGFLARPYETAAAQPNDLAWTEDQVAGLHGPNIATLTGANADGFFTVTGLINWDEDGSNDGDFQGTNGYQDTVMPGFPGTTSLYDNGTEEILTFLQFPAAGVYTMGVNSDDGFKVTTGTNPRDQLDSVLCGSFNGGRGASDTIFQMVVQQAGIYPFRLLWENGGGGMNCEWFTVQPDGTKALINDPAASNTSGIKAYSAGPALPAYVSVFHATPTSLSITLTDAGTQVTASSVKLKVNGADVTPTTSKANAITTVTYSPSTAFASGSANTLALSYADNAGGAITKNASFTMPKYATVDPSWAVTGVDASKSGFKVRPYQVASGEPNTIVFAESELAGKQGANIADLTQTIDGTKIDANGYYTVTGVVNWNEDGSENGNFTDVNGFPDSVLPGQPGTAGGYDNDAEEVLTFLQFPTAGFVTMGVNSDDGFQLTAGPNPAVIPPAAILGSFIGGRGAADTIFSFNVPAAGFYRFRLVWENGGGGANCEWFSVQPDGTKVLVNDSTSPNAIKAYYSGPPPSTGGGGATPNITGITAAAGNVTIQWTNGGTLQSAPAVTGPWNDVAGKTSPATIAATGDASFFRIRQ